MTCWLSALVQLTMTNDNLEMLSDALETSCAMPCFIAAMRGCVWRRGF